MYCYTVILWTCGKKRPLFGQPQFDRRTRAAQRNPEWERGRHNPRGNSRQVKFLPPLGFRGRDEDTPWRNSGLAAWVFTFTPSRNTPANKRAIPFYYTAILFASKLENKMSAFVDRVAKAICESDGTIWEISQTPHRINCRRAAIAAIQAMKEPTPEMLQAGSASHPMIPYHSETKLAEIIEAEWSAMIGEALRI